MSDTWPAKLPLVLVIGATGRTGRHVVDGLLSHGAAVRALVRDPSTASLPERVQVVPGDLDSAASVAAAAKGADAAFLLWHSFESAGGQDVVAALSSHVRHLTYLSAGRLNPETGRQTVAPGVWAEIEAIIERAPVTHTFIRGGGFAVNTLAWAEQIRRSDTVRMPYPQAARPLVDERDLAELAVYGLLEASMVGESVFATGSQTLTQAQQLQTIGTAIGRRLTAVEQSRDEAAAALGGGPFADASLDYWAGLVANPEAPHDGIRQVLGHPARSFADWAQFHADDFTGGVADRRARLQH